MGGGRLAFFSLGLSVLMSFKTVLSFSLAFFSLSSLCLSVLTSLKTVLSFSLAVSASTTPTSGGAGCLDWDDFVLKVCFTDFRIDATSAVILLVFFFGRGSTSGRGHSSLSTLAANLATSLLVLDAEELFWISVVGLELFLVSTVDLDLEELLSVSVVGFDLEGLVSVSVVGLNLEEFVSVSVVGLKALDRSDLTPFKTVPSLSLPGSVLTTLTSGGGVEELAVAAVFNLSARLAWWLSFCVIN